MKRSSCSSLPPLPLHRRRRLSRSPQQAQGRPASRRRGDQVELADGGARLAGAARQDETQKVVQPSTATRRPRRVADAIIDAREGHHRLSRRRQADGRLEEGRALAQSGYGGRFTDYPPRAANGGNCYACHQLDAQGAELRHAGPEPARVRQDPQVRRGRGQGRLRADLQSARRHAVLATCRASGASKFLTIEQIKDLVAYVMSPESPVNK